MKLLVKKYPNPKTVADCQEVDDDFILNENTEGELLSLEEYQGWLALEPQQKALASINEEADADNLARAQALIEAKITALTATGISRETAIALLNLQPTHP